MSEGKIVGVTKIESTEVTIATNTQVSNLDRVWSHIANQSRTNQETIAVKLNSASVIVVMKASLDRVALAYKVLAKNVGDVNVLMSSVEPIESAVSVLLQHRKIGGVELNPVIV